MGTTHEQLAVISDVHGNSPALRAVLDDIDGLGIELVLNLGDSLYGPLDPAGTADIIIERKIPSVLGNEDRIILERLGGEPVREEIGNPSQGFTVSRLTEKHIDWLWSLPQDLYVDPYLYLCHGSPVDDTEYLLWEVGEGGVEMRSEAKIIERLEGIEAEIILCGHDHLQAGHRLDDGRLIVDPGSVGLQAYRDDEPFPHHMETGSPHARYGILRRIGGDWEVEHRVIEYDWEYAARLASGNGRSDWALWLLEGREQ